MDSWDLLDFPRMREVLAAKCQTPTGVEHARRLKPFRLHRQAEEELDKLTEIVELDSEPSLAAGGDIRPLLERARTSGILTGPELLAVGRITALLQACRRFLDDNRQRLVLNYPELDAIAGNDRLAAEVALALDETGMVVDSASAELSVVRKGLRKLRDRLVKRLEAMITASPDYYGERPTIRHDRFVLPVKVEHRDKLPGVVHESSGTGHTLFVEPMATVEDQNRLEDLRSREHEEVSRILRSLSEQVTGCVDILTGGLEQVGRLDFLLAKKRLTEELGCIRPVLTERRLRISGGRHPILEKRKIAVIPLNLELPENVNVLLISGPNAGGKTVALKTVGLFCLLAASGVYVPAEAGTELPFYPSVFADIGDSQSLDADLSSFTAHISKLKDLLESADRQSLVLLDEVGASTSPEEGAALAISVLETLHERGVRVIATSHFWTLKLFVQDNDKMMNAAMGTVDGLPTFRLTLGLPGESSAFEAAAAAGLPAEVLQRARQHVGDEWVDLADRLRQLDRELERVRSSRVEAERQLTQAERLRTDYESRLNSFQADCNRQREQNLVRLKRMLTEARRDIENVVREIRESQASHDSIVQAKNLVQERLDELTVECENTGNPEGAAGLMPGESVESRTLKQQGRVETIENGDAVVAFGMVRMRLPTSDLVRSSESRTDLLRQSFAPGPVIVPGAQLNLMGRTREEALEEMEGYLTDVSAAGMHRVRVLHGKGEGVLQRAVWGALRRDSRIESFKFAEPVEGGTGVTIVELRTDGND